MAKIRPFRANYYNPQRFSDLSPLISPPYDVISPALQTQLYDQHPYNFVRIDFGQEHSDDSPQHNRYTRAAELLAQWRAEKVFEQDPQPGFYLHQQRFSHQGQPLTRSDLFVLCEASDYAEGQVLRHEKTLAGPKADRYQLKEHTQAHLSPVFCVYRDPEAEVQALVAASLQQAPLFSFSENGVAHELYRIADTESVTALEKLLAERPFYIADGHHRYETALNFRRAHYPQIAAAGYLCMYLAALEDPGLLVLPYHRMVRPRFEWPEWPAFLERASQHFEIQQLAASDFPNALTPTQPTQMRLGLQTPEGCWLFSRKQGLPEGIAAERSAAYRKLDVSVLHELLLYELAGFPADKAKDPDYIRFSPDIPVLQQALAQEGGVAFYLNATPVAALCEVAEEGETMPPKSTYFYPKVPSGLLFTCFDSAF